MNRLLVGTLCFLALHAPAQENTAEMRSSRAAAAREKLEKSFAAGAVTGHFVERAVRNFIFIPSAADLPQVNVRNSNALAATAAGPLLDVKGMIDDKGALVITEYALNVAPFQFDQAFPEELRSAGANLMATLNRALKPGAMSVSTQSLEDGSPIAKETLQSIEQIRHAYRDAVNANDDARAKRIAERWAEIRSQVTEVFPASEMYKALYGANDNYDPWRYQLIYRQSAAVVAIGERDRKTARCSGVLIAEDLVLTAGHCFGGSDPRAPAELEVWFNYAKTNDGEVDKARVMRRPIKELVSPKPARLPEMMDGAFGVMLLDYAIVRFKKASADQPLKPADAEPQCLRARHLNKGDAVYAVGFPRGEPMMVHDNARVYLPYVIRKGEQFTQLRLDVEADLLASPQRAELMAEFDKSYELGMENKIEKYFFHHVKDNGQPRLGIVADTFRGNSGGPVYDRDHGQCVTGILVLGAPDTGVRRTVNWKEHERVVPISAVLDDVHANAPQIESQLRLEQP